jgi:hypothetical protein
MKISKSRIKQVVLEALAEAEEGTKPAAGSVLGGGQKIADARQQYKMFSQHNSFAKFVELSGDPVGKLAVAEVVLTSILGVDPKVVQQKKNIILDLLQSQ